MSPLKLAILIPLILLQITCNNNKREELSKGLDFNFNSEAGVVNGSFWSCASYVTSALSTTGDPAIADVAPFFAFFPTFELHWKSAKNETLWISSLTVRLKDKNINAGALFEYVISGLTLFALVGSPNGSIPPNRSLNSQDPSTRPYMIAGGTASSDGKVLPATGRTYPSCGLTISGVPIDPKKAGPFTVTGSIELIGFAIDMSSGNGGQRAIQLKKSLKLSYIGTPSGS